MSELFDVADASLLLLGIGAFVFLFRIAIDNLETRKWWRMESWRERLARWNRQLSL